eukprot:TRINITY_DN145_c0_g2_i1.p1 TRINITY_DN145_c0_g2~~TRINITY_DN145_c0_g2_i1.p1  ORF type:complete len:793 (+),score=227.07 TRINITY_DN145_c0_g2_i1:256-2634(+)
MVEPSGLDDWSAHSTEDGRVYFHNEKTGDTSWELDEFPLKDGWETAVVQESGEVYYCNRDTGKVSWTRPVQSPESSEPSGPPMTSSPSDDEKMKEAILPTPSTATTTQLVDQLDEGNEEGQSDSTKDEETPKEESILTMETELVEDEEEEDTIPVEEDVMDPSVEEEKIDNDEDDDEDGDDGFDEITSPLFQRKLKPSSREDEYFGMAAFTPAKAPGECANPDYDDDTAWEEHTDESTGRKYYYNSKKDYSSWVIPRVFVEKVLPRSASVSESESASSSTGGQGTAGTTTPPTTTTTTTTTSTPASVFEASGDKAEADNTTAVTEGIAIGSSRQERPQLTPNADGRTSSEKPPEGQISGPAIPSTPPPLPEDCSMSGPLPRPSPIASKTSSYIITMKMSSYAFTHFAKKKKAKNLDRLFVHSKTSLTSSLHATLDNYSSTCGQISQAVLEFCTLKKTKGKSRSDASLIETIFQPGLSSLQFRDEIYAQIIRNCNGISAFKKNRNASRAFLLFIVALQIYPPGDTLMSVIQDFVLVASVPEPEDEFRRYIISRMAYAKTIPVRSYLVKEKELDVLSRIPAKIPIFGCSIMEYMFWQRNLFPSFDIPRVLIYLGEQVLIAGGKSEEGIFRKAGSDVDLKDLMLTMAEGSFNVQVDDPHVAANLMKLWLRELPEPLIPVSLYTACVEHARNAKMILNVVAQLPEANRKILVWLLKYIRMFLETDVVKQTCMTRHNMALMLAPNILYNPLADLETARMLAGKEQLFAETLLEYFDEHQLEKIVEYQSGLSEGSEIV